MSKMLLFGVGLVIVYVIGLTMIYNYSLIV